MEIWQITVDSRQVSPGALFVAVRGVHTDGHKYIPEALSRGTAAIVQEGEVECHVENVPHVVVPKSREALAFLSAAWYGHPARSLRTIGVTGTDGKTTTTNLIREVLAAAGYQVGMVSTVNAVVGERSYETGLHTTTPDAPDVQRYLAEMVQARTDYAVLEATSHGLAQGRVAACDFDVAVVTNITHEHLDYHGSHEAYVAAKASLFEVLSEGYRKAGMAKVSVLNVDDQHYTRLRALPADRTLTYGLQSHADVTAGNIREQPEGLAFDAHTSTVTIPLRSGLIGRHNVYNILAAVTVALSQEVSVEAIQQGVANLSSLIGRMERIDEGQDFLAIVDFAHSPGALEQALRTARTLTSEEGRVIAIFGSAGLRDVEKRAWMGHISGELADLTVLTAEDPRTESLAAILAEMAEGCKEGGGVEDESFWCIGDRAQAIAFAVMQAEAGDVVIACGKGHERSMCFGTTEVPWSDQETIRSALRLYKSKAG